MGATHSKKRYKDKQKKKWSSLSLDLPRSLSVDALQPPGLLPSPSTCPLCPHCRSAISWSSDHSDSRRWCLHHSVPGQADGGRDDPDLGQNKVRARGTSTYESCPDCLFPATGKDSVHLCEISNQDYDEMSVMSLNRHMAGRLTSRPGNISTSKSAEFSDLANKQQNKHTKENVNPDLPGHFSNHRSAGLRKNTPESRFSSMAKQRLSSPFSSSNVTSSMQNACTTTVSASSVTQSVPSFPLSSHTADGSHSKGKNSNLSLLDDEEAIKSRWARKKQMAQELRTLRMHLQTQEMASEQTRIQSHYDHGDIVVDNANTDYTPVSVTHTAVPPVLETVTNSHTDTSTTIDSVALVNMQDSNRQNVSLCSYNTDTENTDTVSTNTSDKSTPTLSPSRSVRSKFSRLGNYRYFDNHPVMTRLQNEQNNRLELMERRMDEIRVNAMREAERRKFAEIFPAKTDDSETQKLMREARESLERMKEEKRKKVLSQNDENQQIFHDGEESNSVPSNDISQNDDSGEIIPVCVLLSSSTRDTTPVNVRSQNPVVSQKKCEQGTQWSWLTTDWPDINLGQPLTWLWLPFMLFPLVLRMLVSMITNHLPASTGPRNSQSANMGCSNSADSSRSSLSTHKRKK